MSTLLQILHCYDSHTYKQYNMTSRINRLYETKEATNDILQTFKVAYALWRDAFIVNMKLNHFEARNSQTANIDQ